MIAVADPARHGARLSELGVDVLVDRQDPVRAVEIIRGVTDGNLRFALDTVGKETATYLRDTLQDTAKGRASHLVGLTGLPKEQLAGVKHHKVPIKVFHTVSLIGEKTMNWLEELLVEKVLIFPEVAIADGGLAGINNALDRLRSGRISGKRLVVPIESHRADGANLDTSKQMPVHGTRTVANEAIPSDAPEQGSAESTEKSPSEDKASNQTDVRGSGIENVISNGVDSSPNESKPLVHELDYADRLNEDPSRLKFA